MRHAADAAARSAAVLIGWNRDVSPSRSTSKTFEERVDVSSLRKR
jgi:hypothetical protein